MPLFPVSALGPGDADDVIALIEARCFNFFCQSGMDLSASGCGAGDAGGVAALTGARCFSFCCHSGMALPASGCVAAGAAGVAGIAASTGARCLSFFFHSGEFEAAGVSLVVVIFGMAAGFVAGAALEESP